MAMNEGFEATHIFCVESQCKGHKWAFHQLNNYEDCPCDPQLFVDPFGVVIIISHRYPSGIHEKVTLRPPNAK